MNLKTALRFGALVTALWVTPPDASAAETNTVRGTVAKTNASTKTVTVRQNTGTEVTLTLGAGSRVEVDGKPGRFDQIKEGQRVRATYLTKDGKNEVVLLKPAVVTDEQLGREVKQALAAVKSYTFQQKDKYAAELSNTADDIDDRIDQLEVEAKDAGAEAKAKLQIRIAQLRKQRGVLNDRLARVQTATANAWDEVKTGVGDALSELQKGINDLIKN